MTALRLAAVFWALLLAGVCRAQDASYSLAALCPTRQALATLVEAAAHSARVRPVVLVAMARVESTCDPSAVNRRTGALGWLQVLPGRSADPDHLETDELVDPAVNIGLGARHLRRCIDLCGTLPAGLHVFHGGKKCREWRGDRYVKRVLGYVAQARRWLARQALRTS
jgi:hypothetical protein